MDNNGNPFVGAGHINMAGQVGQANLKYGRRQRAGQRASKYAGSNPFFRLSNVFGARGNAKRDLEGRVIKTLALGSAENAVHLDKIKQSADLHTSMREHVISSLPEGHRLVDYSYGAQGLKYSARPNEIDKPEKEENQERDQA